MAISTLVNPVNYNLNTALGAHNLMLAIHSHMTKVGLSRVMTGTDYNLAGDETQLSSTFGDTSGWLAYNFTDAAQSNYPLTIWFRIVRGQWLTSATSGALWGPQYRVTEGISGGAPLGANFENYDGVNGVGTSAAYVHTFSGSLGDFVRYDGNSLTVLIGLHGWYASYSGTPRTSIIELHMERRYSAINGELGGGWCGWFSPGGPGQPPPPHWVTGGVNWASLNDPKTRPVTYVSSQNGANIFFRDGQARSTSPPLLTTGGAAVIAPVMFLDQASRPTLAAKVFTGPYSVLPNLSVTYMDFTGVDKKYLAYRPQDNTMADGAISFLFEWE